MIVKVVCATGDLSIAEEGHENTNREALYDTFLAPKEAVIVRFEGVFYSIVHVYRYWEYLDGAVSTRLGEGYRRKRFGQQSAAFIGL